MDSVPQLKIFCNQCSHTTNHIEIAMRKARGNDDHESHPSSWVTTSQMLECCGCESVSLRIGYWHSDYDARDEDEFYPPRISRRPPSWQWRLPDEWRFLLTEVYQALHADSKRLAMMGARAIIDIYMNDAVGDLGNFAKKLEALVNKRHITESDKVILSAALEAGHAAAHRGHLPKPSEIAHVMDIIENLLQRHALKYSAAELSQGTPSRPKATP